MLIAKRDVYFQAAGKLGVTGHPGSTIIGHALSHRYGQSFHLPGEAVESGPGTNPIARSAPNSEQDLVIAAKHNYVLASDNLSTIKPALPDAFCRIATGGGFGTRKLHTDADEMLFSATRPCLLNGILDLANRPGLADRAIVVSLPVIAPTARAFEGEFNTALEAVMPRILAGLLEAVCAALANQGSVRLTERPRMADFAKWVTAAEQTLGWPEGAFLSAYSANRRQSEEAALDSNAVASTILSMIQENTFWQGTTGDLIQYLRKRYPTQTEGNETFPRQPTAFGTELRRVTPILRSHGILVSHSRTGKDRRRIIELKRA